MVGVKRRQVRGKRNGLFNSLLHQRLVVNVQVLAAVVLGCERGARENKVE